MSGCPEDAAADLADQLPEHLLVFGPDQPATLEIRDKLADSHGHSSQPDRAAADFASLFGDYV